MPIVSSWEFQQFPVGEIESQRIDFQVDDHDFLMLFTPVLASGNDEYIRFRSETVGFDIPHNSYDVKFDRVENFESGNFYAPPVEKWSKIDFRKMSRLGQELVQILEFHMVVTGAEAYFAAAENHGLKRFYDRLAKQRAQSIQCQVITNLGEEGLDYAIKTSRFKY
jgi:hypothetical protein